MFRPRLRPRMAALVSSSAVLSLTLAVACSDGGGPMTGPIVDVDPDAGLGDGGPVASEDLCGDGLDQDLDGVADDECNVVFVTSTPVSLASLAATGDVLAAADAHCDALAGDAGLDGTFVAYLSTKQAPVFSRIADRRGFVRVDGKPIADTATQLIGGYFRYPIALTETGEATDAVVATATTGNGLFATDAGCSNFTNLSAERQIRAGVANASTHMFSDSTSRSCDLEQLLYCVETDHATPLAPGSLPDAPVHVAFVSSDPITPGAGIPAADALCAAEALDAGLEGEFVALLPVSGATPIHRLVSDGRPVVRVDGVVVAESEEAFGALDWLAPISLHAVAPYQEGDSLVWVAAATPNDSGVSDCGSFANASADSSALVQVAGLPWTAEATTTSTCDSATGRVYCVSR